MAAKPGAGLGSILRDKRVLIGVAVAGGAGLLALVMRKGGGSQTPATLDTSSGDLSSALQSYLDQLANVADQLNNRPSSGTGSQPPPPPVPVDFPRPPRPTPTPGPVSTKWPHQPPIVIGRG